MKGTLNSVYNTTCFLFQTQAFGTLDATPAITEEHKKLFHKDLVRYGPNYLRVVLIAAKATLPRIGRGQ
jgi:hypothetical protein